ncbi:hypothetical protein [Paenibacillus xylanexedens]|uniref:hypothetical protein n=1 Tax=Paenibacillus TaxID=44249 RepID=UPI001B3AEFC0|nr:hypothetical protein [Paenibacillus xylanexedens]
MIKRYKYVPKHREDEHYLDQYGQPVQSFMKAIKFYTNDDDYAEWLLGRYGPANPQNYFPSPIEITYKELEVDVDANS